MNQFDLTDASTVIFPPFDGHRGMETRPPTQEVSNAEEDDPEGQEDDAGFDGSTPVSFDANRCCWLCALA